MAAIPGSERDRQKLAPDTQLYSLGFCRIVLCCHFCLMKAPSSSFLLSSVKFLQKPIMCLTSTLSPVDPIPEATRWTRFLPGFPLSNSLLCLEHSTGLPLPESDSYFIYIKDSKDSRLNCSDMAWNVHIVSHFGHMHLLNTLNVDVNYHYYATKTSFCTC